MSGNPTNDRTTPFTAPWCWTIKKPYLVLGSPGADGQTQTVTQLITGVLDFGLDPQQAVDAPRWRDNPDGSLMIEGRLSADSAAYLESRGL